MPQGLTTVFTEPGKPFELETLSTPEIEPGGILIKNTDAVICGSDLHYVRRDKAVPIGAIPGHEIGGVLSAVGSNVKHVQEGDMVGVEPVVRCGAVTA